MRVPMPAEREETRAALAAAVLRVCDLPDSLNIIHDEVKGSVVEISARLPQDGWPFARLCRKKSIDAFMALHDALLKCVVLAGRLSQGQEKRELEKLLAERDFAAAVRLHDEILEKTDEAGRRALALAEKAERLYRRPELRCGLYIVLNQKRKFIFNMQSGLGGGISLIRPKKFPRTCAAVPSLEDVRQLILINLAQIRPDVVGWLNPIGLALLETQKFKGWRG